MHDKYLIIAALCAATWALWPGESARADTSSGSLSGQIYIGQGPDRQAAAAGVVVYLDAAPQLDDATEGSKDFHQVSQKNEIFSPHLTVIAKGGTVAFPNDDRVFHNVFSLSSTTRFDLGLYRDGDTRSVTFKRVGVVDVHCNIHPKMAARVLVVPNRFYTRTDEHGKFAMTGIPAGTYTAIAWNGSETRTQVEIRAANTAEVAVELAPAPRQKRHQRKDGSPYGRYH